jgi:hypothetical protein
MKRIALFWILAFLVTAVSAVYQRVTGPTYPLSGKQLLGDVTVSFRFLRSQGGTEDAPVRVTAADSTITGVVEWKRYKTSDAWNTLPMQRHGATLAAALPNQPPAGKLEYRVVLTKGAESVILPEEGGVIIRFKGDVPAMILIIHVFAMFGAMLLSTRTGLEYFNPEPHLKRLISWTIGFLVFGGLIMGPIVQKYAFDAYWTGWPFGTDLTDNKTFVGLLGWIVVAFALRRSKYPTRWALAASVFLFVVYLIPHSMLGSELDYSKMPLKTSQGVESSK